jgi:hypothetical protein
MTLYRGLTAPDQWPTTAADDVPCFRCDRPLFDFEVTENAPGNGQWRAHCLACDMFTYFDRK